MLAYAARIELCNSGQNQWYGHGLTTKTGRRFDAHGRFWHCKHKHCSACVRRSTNKARRLIFEAIDGQHPKIGERYKMLTLTIPNEGRPIFQQRDLLNATWAIFRKRPWFKAKVRGYAKDEEFTVTQRGYHYHIHALTLSKYLDYDQMRAEWTEAAKQAYADANIPLIVNTKQGQLRAHCSQKHDTAKLVFESAKYITKAESWRTMPAERLLETCRVDRWPRMFELGGTFKLPRQARERANQNEDTKSTILDERPLSERTLRNRWRRQLALTGATQYICQLRLEIDRTIAFRQAQIRKTYPTAQLYTQPATGPPISLAIIRRMQLADTAARTEKIARGEFLWNGNVREFL